MKSINEINWDNCLIQGYPHPIKSFIEFFNKIPNVYEYTTDEFSIEFENLEKLNEIFPESIIFFNDYSKIKLDNDKLKIYDNLEDCNNYSVTKVLIFDIKNESIYKIDSDSCINIYCKSKLYSDEVVIKILDILCIKKITPAKGEINLVVFDRYYDTITSEIELTNINIKENYNDDFINVYDDIISFLNIRKSGLIILRGLMGTGKTTFIRHLITNYPKDYILITNSIAQNLSSPEFISFMISNKDSVFILEDCEQILLDRSENMFNNAISSILNISDGLMSDIFNIKLICTFNADITEIDPALLRKGRCYANYEFSKLDVNKTKNLLNNNNIYLNKYEPLTLAEIYNYSQESHNQKSKNKIGF